MEKLHAAYVTSPTGRRCVLRPVETGRSLDLQLSPANREWVLRVDEVTGAEYWFSTKTHDTLAEPPLIEDIDSPLPKLLRKAEAEGKRVHLGARPEPTNAGPVHWNVADDESHHPGHREQDDDDYYSDDDEKAARCPARPTNALRWNFDKRRRPDRVDMVAIHRRFLAVQPKQRAFERINLIPNGTKVMFWSEELEKSVRAVVDNGKNDPSNSTSMARRSNGIAFYRVKIVRMSKRDKTRPSRKPPIFATVEASLLELPDVYTKRVFCNSLNKLNMYTMAHGWAVWVGRVRHARHEAFRDECAARIQRKWNLSKLKLAGAAEAALILETRRRREAELERRRRIAERRRKKEAYDKYKKRVGITPDGVNFFLTKREMQMFLYRRSVILQKAAKVLGPFWKGQDHRNKMKAIAQWKAVVADETAHYRKAANEDWTLAHIPEIRQKIKDELGAWHGAQGINIPQKGPPPTGVCPRKDGSVQILDLKQWHLPILRPSLLFGAYPEGPSRLDSTRMNARTPCINALAQAKVACYVCLLTDAEVKAHGKGFTDVIGKLARQQETILRNQVKSRIMVRISHSVFLLLSSWTFAHQHM